MSLYVYNTLARKKEIFEPIESDHVRMYVCGVTVYDECHLGHGRVYVIFDMIRRYLRHLGYKVTYVQNFTDIDDKIIKKAVTEREKNKKMSLIEHTKAITEKYTNLYFSQMDALGVARADHYPKATEHIQHMQAMIGDLIRKEMAYDVDGDVYFSVKTFHAYGKLSKRNLDELLIGARVE
ncbi:cysteine--tRNA ligase, partial [PVC group bacterium]|nr:cysteine--tRNA ligase [PVC group bacterium]